MSREGMLKESTRFKLDYELCKERLYGSSGISQTDEVEA